MKEPKPEWYGGLRQEPFGRRTFTLENIRKIEEQAAKMERESGNPSMRLRRLALSAAAFAVAVFVGLSVYGERVADSGQTQSGLPAVSSPSAASPASPDSTGTNAFEHPYWLKSDVQVLEKPEAYGSMPKLFEARMGPVFYVKERQGEFARVVNPLLSSTLSDGWIPQWYLTEDESDKAEKPDAPYEMIVKTAVPFRLYPDEPKPSGFELEPGKVVQVTAKYGDWMRVEIKTYDSPYAGDKWVPASALEAWDPAKAKEGLLRGPDTPVYNEAGEELDRLPWLEPIRIDGEAGGRYRIGAPGGFTGYVDKSEFVPNPFAYKIIDQSGTQTPDPNWVMSEGDKQAYENFAKNHSEDALKDKTPLQIFRYFVVSVEAGDYRTAHALFIQGPEYATPDLKTFLADIESDPNTQQIDRMTWEQRKQKYQLAEQIDGDAAAIVMTESNGTTADRISFGLTRNKDGIWKVNWMPTQ